MKAVKLLVVLSLVLGSYPAKAILVQAAAPTAKSSPSPPEPKKQEPPVAPPQTEYPPLIHTNDNSKGAGSDSSSITIKWHDLLFFPGILAFVGSMIALAVTRNNYLKTQALSREISDRTVRIEAQKLLLEINKQFLSNPDLFAVYDDEFDKLPLARQQDAKLRTSLRAVAYMKLNIFEIVFAVHPTGVEESAWKSFFKDSLTKCTLVRKSLREHSELYNKVLIGLYDQYKSALPADKVYPPLVADPAVGANALPFDEKTIMKLQTLAATLPEPAETKPQNANPAIVTGEIVN
jgi:hypothetical protein